MNDLEMSLNERSFQGRRKGGNGKLSNLTPNLQRQKNDRNEKRKNPRITNEERNVPRKLRNEGQEENY